MEESSQLQMLITSQQRMADDITSIKIAIEKGIQGFDYLKRDMEDLEKRQEKLELFHTACPARAKANAWSITMKDVAWLIAFIGTILALFQIKKG